MGLKKLNSPVSPSRIRRRMCGF